MKEGMYNMAKLINSEQIICTIQNKPYDFDRYNFEGRSALSTHETSVDVDFLNQQIKGDKIAYGEYGRLDLSECIELLQTLQPNEIIRDFSELISG